MLLGISLVGQWVGLFADVIGILGSTHKWAWGYSLVIVIMATRIIWSLFRHLRSVDESVGLPPMTSRQRTLSIMLVSLVWSSCLSLLIAALSQ